MGVITPDRFDPFKAYCNVRLQQGVPLVDADVNELDDIRKFEMRAFLKWFVGNGIPEGNDGFRIAPVSGATAATDLQILNATPSPGPAPASPSAAANEYAVRAFGRCIVDGLDVIIPASKLYSAQPLSAVDLAAPYSLPAVAPIPNINGPVVAYLDVWERVVAPTEDSSLVVPPLGTESCARVKRQWVVRTIAGLSAPANAVINGVPHHYYALALINRHLLGVNNPAPIVAADITDVRDRGLSLTPSTLIPDVLGTTAAGYRQGNKRPAISLRDAINAVARGQVPSLPEHTVTSAPSGSIESGGRATLDGANGLVLTWAGGSAQLQIFAGRLDFGAPTAGFASATQITAGANNYNSPAIVALPSGELLLAYRGAVGNTSDIYFRRAPTVAALAAAPEMKLTSAAPNTPATLPLVVVSGNVVVFFYKQQPLGGPASYNYRRYDAASSAFLDGAAVPIADANGDLHATTDSAGDVWFAFTTVTAPAGVRLMRLTPSSNAPPVQMLSAASGADVYRAPFVLCAPTQQWVFWYGDNSGLWRANRNGPAPLPTGPTAPVSYTSKGDANPVAVYDALGDRVILAFDRPIPPNGNTNVFLQQSDAGTGGWLPPAAATVAGSSDTLGIPLQGATGGLIFGGGGLWSYWMRLNQLQQTRRLYYRELCVPL